MDIKEERKRKEEEHGEEHPQTPEEYPLLMKKNLIFKYLEWDIKYPSTSPETVSVV